MAGPYNRGKGSGSDISPEEQLRRTPLPKQGQIFGLVEQRVGGSRMIVRCMDGKVRNCRIPGRLKKRLWVREGDLVVVEPWEFGGDEKGDVLIKYKNNQVTYLKNKGYLKRLLDVDEF